MEPRLIMFDFDGTLMDSQHAILTAMSQSFAAQGEPVPSDDNIKGIIGLSLKKAVAALAPELPDERHQVLSDGYKHAYVALRNTGTDKEALFPGARALLEELCAVPNIVLGIATGKTRRGLLGALEREALASHFVTLQTADDAPSKPDPGMLLQAMGETGIAPAQTLMIGDATFDMAMAKNAQVTGLGVSWGYHDAEALQAAGAQDIATSFEALRRFILSPQKLEGVSA